MVRLEEGFVHNIFELSTKLPTSGKNRNFLMNQKISPLLIKHAPKLVNLVLFVQNFKWVGGYGHPCIYRPIDSSERPPIS